MLPVVATEQVTRQMVIYTVATVIASLCLIPPRASSTPPSPCSPVRGSPSAWEVVPRHVRGPGIVPLKVFLQSNEYLAPLFCGLAVDAVFHLPTIASYFS